MCTNCDQQSTTNCSNPCSICGGCSCTCSSLYSNVGCLNITSSDCTKYLGNTDLSCVGIRNGDTLTSALTSLSNYASGTLDRITSSTIGLTYTGQCRDNLDLEVVPSTQLQNILTYGIDGKLYVPKTDLTLVSTTCISWQKTTVGQVITYVPIIDWNCVAQQVCVLCSNPSPCVAPTGLMVLSTGQTTAQIGWNSVAGTTYNVLVNGVVQGTGVSSPYTFNSLVPSTTYSLTIRAVCASGTTADTTISVTTLAVTACVLPSGITASITSGEASLAWTPGGGGGTQVVEYKLASAPTWTQYAVYGSTTSSALISGLSSNVIYNFRITNNCSGGAAAAGTSSSIGLACIALSNVTTDTTVASTFTPSGGDVDTIVVQLYDSTGTTLLQTQTFLAPFASSLTATFQGLTASTTYQLVAVPSIGTTYTNTTCSKVTATTTSVPGCALPTNLTVTIS